MWNCENMKLWKYENVGRTLGIGCFHISTLSHLHIATKSLIALTVSIFAYFPNSAIAQAVVVQAHPGDEYVPPKSPLVREKLEWFRDQKLCLMMHFGVYSFLGITESWPLSTKDAFWARTDIECVRVRHLASGFNIPFAEANGDTRGVILTFPGGFVRDEYADAFMVEYRWPRKD